MSNIVFSIKELNKSFGQKQILKNINLDIHKGEIIGIIGASGAGKTTFLNTLIGFLKPDSGDVLFRFETMLSYKKGHMFKSVFDNQRIIKKMYGFTSQVPSFYEELTPSENLDYFGHLHNLNKETIKTNRDILLRLMNLENASRIKSKYLSGGMERRLDIACSLMHNPEVLILDEPTADLDPILRSHIWDLIRKINSKGTTIILSSHHLSELELLCDRVVILKDGHLIAKGKPSELKKEFVKVEEIIIQSKPGKYSQIVSELKKKKIIDLDIKKDELRIFSSNPEKDLFKILAVLKKKKEKLTFIKMAGSSLDDVFINLWKDEK